MLKILKNFASLALSLTIITAIFVSMGWHKSPKVQDALTRPIYVYDSTIGKLTGHKINSKKSLVTRVWERLYQNISGFFSSILERGSDNLVDILTKEIPRYLALAFLGYFVYKKFGIRNV